MSILRRKIWDEVSQKSCLEKDPYFWLSNVIEMSMDN